MNGKIWGREPAMFLAVLGAGIALATSFGLQLSAEQVGGIMAFVNVVLGWITRSQVTPVEDPRV